MPLNDSDYTELRPSGSLQFHYPTVTMTMMPPHVSVVLRLSIPRYHLASIFWLFDGPCSVVRITPA